MRTIIRTTTSKSVRRLMLLIGCLAAGAVAFAATPTVAVANHLPLPSTTDLWDISQGTVVTDHSPVLFTNTLRHSDIRNMFGGNFGPVESSNTLFQDGEPAGTLHWVEWQTEEPVTLRSFTLHAAHDIADEIAPRDANWRGFSQFRLYAFNEGTGEFDNLLFEISTANPYGDTEAPPSSFIEIVTEPDTLILHANVTPTTTDRFRAEFVQFGDVEFYASGPRILELDGWDTSHKFASEVTLTTDETALWPPNRQMVPVTILVSASDTCAGSDDLLVVCQITSSQPDDSGGTGKHIGDVNGDDGFVAPVEIELQNLGDGKYGAEVLLRAERDGGDPAGRTYSINVISLDRAGNISEASTTVVVPHNQRGKKR